MSCTWGEDEILMLLIIVEKGSIRSSVWAVAEGTCRVPVASASPSRQYQSQLSEPVPIASASAVPGREKDGAMEQANKWTPHAIEWLARAVCAVPWRCLVERRGHGCNRLLESCQQQRSFAHALHSIISRPVFSAP